MSLLLKTLNQLNLNVRENVWNPLLAAHRGGIFPKCFENTAATFDKTQSYCTILETDVRMTKDGETVIAHDDHLYRARGERTVLSQTNSDSLPIFDPYLETENDEDKKANKNKILKLDDFLKRYQASFAFIDIKYHNCEFAEKVYQIILDNKAQERVGVGSFSMEIEEFLDAKNSSMPTFYSLKGVLKLMFEIYSGLLLFQRIKPKILILPAPSEIKPHLCLHSILSSIYQGFVFNRFTLKILKMKQIPVGLYTINTYDDFIFARSIRASIVVSDYPKKIITWLNAMNNEGEFAIT